MTRHENSFMSRRLPGLVFLFLAAACAVAAEAAGPERPNVVFIIVDDSESIEYGCYGGDVLTPNIDRLAVEGVRFTHGFTSSSVCTPTRYTCLTGQYAGRAASLRTEDHQTPDMPSFVRWNTYLEAGGRNIASVLQQHGYATGLAGKWHVGHGGSGDALPSPPAAYRGQERLPLEDPEINAYFRDRYRAETALIRRNFGFDYVAAYYGGNLTGWPASVQNFAKHNQDWITDGALRFIDEHAGEGPPFFLYLATTLQHGPSPIASLEADRRITPSGLLAEPADVQPGAASIYRRLEVAGVPRETAPFTWLDDGVGAVMDRLKEHGIYEDTLVFFFSDQQSWGKGSCHDGGVNTPYIMSWPSGFDGGQVLDELVGNIDFAPTIFDACGATVPGDMHLDGRSLLPLARGTAPMWREALFFELGDMRAVRTRDFKYIATRHFSEEAWAALPEEVQRLQEYRTRYFRLADEWTRSSAEHLQHSAVAKWRYDHAVYAGDANQLYDLRIDPSENVNLHGNREYASVQETMKRLLAEWLAGMPGPYWEFKTTGQGALP